jgi:hypothetical protein
MQKFSGIYMGRRRKQTGEPEADMEGSGEDNEPQVLASFAKDLQQFYTSDRECIGAPFTGKPGGSA